MHPLEAGAWSIEGQWVVGCVTNSKPNAAGWVTVEFGLYDKEGSLLGTTKDAVGRLYKCEVWKYHCPILVPGVANAKMRSFTWE